MTTTNPDHVMQRCHKPGTHWPHTWNNHPLDDDPDKWCDGDHHLIERREVIARAVIQLAAGHPDVALLALIVSVHNQARANGVRSANIPWRPEVVAR